VIGGFALVWLGSDAGKVIDHIGKFVETAVDAKSNDDLENAAQHLATAISIVFGDGAILYLGGKIGANEKPSGSNAVKTPAELNSGPSTNPLGGPPPVSPLSGGCARPPGPPFRTPLPERPTQWGSPSGHGLPRPPDPSVQS